MIDLSNNDFNQYSSSEIGGVLLKNHIIEKISLANCQLTDRVSINIFDMLSMNTKLTHLNLSGNCISDASTEAIAGYLKDSKMRCQMIKLNLSKNRIMEPGGEVIAWALEVSMYPPQMIDLSFNFIKDNAAWLIVDAASWNVRIT